MTSRLVLDTLEGRSVTGNIITVSNGHSIVSNTINVGTLSGVGQMGNVIIVPAGHKFHAPGHIIGVNVIRSSTRTSVGYSASSTIVSGSFTKLRGDTTLVASCTIYGCQYSSGTCGVGMNIDGSNWDYGSGYQYDGSWSSTGQITIVTGTARWTGITAGSHTVGFGWQPVNGSTGERPFGILNPNSSDESRNQQCVSSITVYEVMP